MAQDPFTTAEVQPGKPTKSELFRKTKQNIEDLDTRQSASEIGATARPPITFEIVGTLNAPFAQDGLLHQPIDIALTIVGVRSRVITAGASGTFTTDIEYKRGGAAWVSILDEPVSVESADGNLALESGVLAVTELEPGDILRYNVDAVQAGMNGALTHVECEVRSE